MIANEVYISVGSNSGDAFDKIEGARKVLACLLDDFRNSSSYHTAPLSGIGPDYGNAVFYGLTALTTSELETLLKQLEKDFGRDDEARRGGRVPLDLDIVIFGNSVVRPKDFNRDYFQRGYREITPRP